MMFRHSSRLRKGLVVATPSEAAFLVGCIIVGMVVVVNWALGMVLGLLVGLLP